jgi:hypothetical protein
MLVEATVGLYVSFALSNIVQSLQTIAYSYRVVQDCSLSNLLIVIGRETG